ncbi:MAG: GWxTD domain-containing protein, partial [Rhodothermales bacterium]|nr:GWxTD domain-containing protein [Rhodothermales bacterium]
MKMLTSMLTRTGRCLCLAVVFGVLAFSDARAQGVLPEFYVDVMGVASEGDSGYNRIDLYTRVPYPRLTFLNSPDGFQAGYVVTVEALLHDGDRLTSTPVQTRIWEGSATADIYLATQSDELSSYTTQSLQLPPGRYQLSFQVEDRNSSQVFVRDLPLEVRDLSGSALSDVAILDSYDAQTLEFIPRVNNRVGTDELSMQVLYESYSDMGADVRLEHELVGVYREGEITTLPVGSEVTVYEESQALEIRQGRNQHVVTVPLDGMEVGPHELRIRMVDESGAVLDEVSKPFTAVWTGLEQHIADLEEAIEQLDYIAKKPELEYIRQGPTEGDRYRRFREYWEKLDPTPGTQRNERMEEYYYRMSFANQRYTSLVKGWRTDRGFVLVRFGEPDFIRKKPHTFDYEPYEVWIYERIGRQFIFVDKTGFGDYQLLVPIWD